MTALDPSTDPEIVIESDHGPLWEAVVGQDAAVDQLIAAAAGPVHAYLLLGPHGSGKRAAARAFAALLLSEGLEGGAEERAQRLALQEQHPDLITFEPEGRTLRVDDTTPIITEASRTPVEGPRKVLLIDRFHVAEPESAARLLKTIEEPVATTVLVLLTEDVPPEHITIASRCVTVEFWAIAEAVIERWLSARGVRDQQAAMVAVAAQGDLRRAELLTTDPELASRHELWTSVPDRLDGTGARVAQLVDEIRVRIDEAQAPLDAQHEQELEDMTAREEQLGTRGSGRKDLIAKQKREIRKHRDDELRFGLAVMAKVYRDQLMAAPTATLVSAIDRLRMTNEHLARNPSEELMLQALLLDLPIR